jgi:endonuclease/exonuclease/phosphatase family metal-dependent hydrolase
MTRILTYNVHRCVGTDRRLDVGRVADVIAAQEPDIVALQEVDVGRARTFGVDQANAIADRLGMVSRFHPAMTVEAELYGDAILTDLPERVVRAGALPGHPRFPQLEPRGALWLAVDVNGVELQVINTHLGLVPREQRLQAAALVGHDWLGRLEGHAPRIIVGDMNAGPWSETHRILTRDLICARKTMGVRAATFPSAMPVLQIDHVLVNAAIRITGLSVAAEGPARRASDHLPLVVDFELQR